MKTEYKKDGEKSPSFLSIYKSYRALFVFGNSKSSCREIEVNLLISCGVCDILDLLEYTLKGQM